MLKKIISIILICAMAVIFTACSGDNTSFVSGNSNTSSDTSKPQNNITVENTPNKVDDTLPQCEPANSCYEGVMKGDSGYYYKDSWWISENASFRGIVYYDIATGKSIPLCSKPQCMHDGNAFCASSGFNSRYEILYNGYIYRLGVVQDEETFKLVLMKMDLMGNELSVVSDIITSVGAYPNVCSIVVHYGKLIFSLDKTTTNDTRDLYMVDLASGECKKIHIPEAENGMIRWRSHTLNYIVCDGDWLYYTLREVKLKKSEYGLVETNLVYNKIVMCRYNLKNGETEIISDMPNIYSSFTVNNGIIYYTVVDRSSNTFSLYAYDTMKKSSATLAQNIQQEFLDGKYVGDIIKVTVLTDRKYLYICTRGVSGSSGLKEEVDDIDFYVYDFEGNQLLHGLSGMETFLDMEKEWSYSFSALDGEIYICYQDYDEWNSGSDENIKSGMYRIKTADLVNGSTDWQKLYTVVK